MDWLPQFDPAHFFGRSPAQGVVQAGMLQFFHFTLVLFRLSGLMMTAPGFSHSAIPIQIRLLVILGIAMLVTPNLAQFNREGFQRLDLNADHLLQPGEIPTVLEPRVAALKQAQGLSPSPDDTLTPAEFTFATQFPPTLLDYLWIVLGELGLGLLLGMGVMITLSALQMSGQMIDQQAGTSLGELFNPELNSSVSVTGEMLYLLGSVIFFTLGGHRLLLDSLIETFQTFPVGQSYLSSDAISLLSDLVHQSLILALQVSAPIMATMSLLTLAMGFLGHTVPQINILVFGFPVKVLAGFFVVSLALSGMGELIADSVPHTLSSLRSTLSGLEAEDESPEDEPPVLRTIPREAR